MSIDYNNLKTKVHRFQLEIRNIETLVNTPMFERVYDSSSDEDKKWVDEQVKRGGKDALRSWIKCHPSFDILDCGTRYLKNLAKCYHIVNWSRLSKLELVEAIMQKEKEYNVLDKED